MACFLRLFILGLLLSMSLPAAAEAVSRDDLASHKELLQLKLDSQRELAQKDTDALKARIDALEKRIDDQNNRVDDIGQGVDRFSVIVGITGILVTLFLAAGGFIGGFSVAQKAKREAREEAKNESKKIAEKVSSEWFNSNNFSLLDKIKELEKAAEQAHQNIKQSVQDVQQQRATAIATMQENMRNKNSGTPHISTQEKEALKRAAEHLREKPETSYSFDDWNTRAFAAISDGNYDNAAIYWKNASETISTEPIDKAISLLNLGVALSHSRRHEEALESFQKLIDSYSTDDTPEIRKQVTYAFNGKGFALLMLAKQAWQEKTQAEKLLKAAEESLQDSRSRDGNHGFILGNLAYVQWLQGNHAEAEQTFRAALNSPNDGGEQLYQATLDDIAMYPIPEDKSFWAMIERLWSEHQQWAGDTPGTALPAPAVATT